MRHFRSSSDCSFPNCRILTLEPHSEYIEDPDRAARAMKMGDYSVYIWKETPMRGNPDVRIRYGRWTEDPKGTWFLCDALSYSDYSGTKPTFESNVRVFAEEFSRGEGKWWIWADGGHDTTAILIRTLAYRNSSEIRDLINGLADYPLLDEGDSSDLEMDREMEGWADYGRGDFKRALVTYLDKRFSARGRTCDDSGRDADTIVDSLTDDQVSALYQARCQETNINGGGTCLWEGESHPSFFCNEMAYGLDSSYHQEFGRNPWDGFVPALDASGKVSYHAGEVSDWIPVCAWKPSCPRCGKIGEIQDEPVPHGSISLWDSHCDDPGCDVPVTGEKADLALAEIAAFILRSWDVFRLGRFNHLHYRDPVDVGPSFDRLANACEAKGDRFAALALHFRRNERFPNLMLAGEIQYVTRQVLREIVTGERPMPSTIAHDDMCQKPLCCVVYNSSCCAHGENRKRDEKEGRKPFCVRVNVRGACSICGGTRDEKGG